MRSSRAQSQARRRSTTPSACVTSRSARRSSSKTRTSSKASSKRLQTETVALVSSSKYSGSEFDPRPIVCHYKGNHASNQHPSNRHRSFVFGGVRQRGTEEESTARKDGEEGAAAQEDPAGHRGSEEEALAEHGDLQIRHVEGRSPREPSEGSRRALRREDQSHERYPDAGSPAQRKEDGARAHRVDVRLVRRQEGWLGRLDRRG